MLLNKRILLSHFYEAPLTVQFLENVTENAVTSYLFVFLWVVIFIFCIFLVQKWKLRMLSNKYLDCRALAPEMLLWNTLKTDSKYICVTVLRVYKVKDNRQKSHLCNSFDPLGLLNHASLTSGLPLSSYLQILVKSGISYFCPRWLLFTSRRQNI